MTREIKEKRLILLIEECAEVSQCATKIMRFGEEANNYGKNQYDNITHLLVEIGDLLAVIETLPQEQKEQIKVFKTRKLDELRFLGY